MQSLDVTNMHRFHLPVIDKFFSSFSSFISCVCFTLDRSLRFYKLVQDFSSDREYVINGMQLLMKCEEGHAVSVNLSRS